MSSNNIIPDEVLFNSLLDGCSKCAIKYLLIKVYKQMIKMNIQPSSVTYNSLIDGYVRCGDIKSAWE